MDDLSYIVFSWNVMYGRGIRQLGDILFHERRIFWNDLRHEKLRTTDRMSSILTGLPQDSRL